jgi:DNA polymerase-3 subunit beta
MKITIDHNIAKALLICAAKQDIRYYLKGICVDARANGDVVLVTTDGHRLLAYPVATDAIEALAPGQYIIPREALEAVKPCKAGRHMLPITIEIDTAKGLENKITGATSTVTPLIDGKFPDWRRVLPKTVSGEPAQYQAEYLGDFGRIADLLGTKQPHIHYNGSAAAIVGNLGAALGVLMPMRSDAEFSALPAWALA